MDLPAPPTSLTDAIKAGRAIAVVGSGLSIAAGGPSWEELLLGIAAEAAEQQPRSLARIADALREIRDHRYLNAGSLLKSVLGSTTFNNCILRQLEKRRPVEVDDLALADASYREKNGLFRKLGTAEARNMEPTPSHRLLMQLNFKAIVTTNYDGLLEAATPPSQLSKMGVYSRSSKSLAGAIDDDRRFILKLHGDANYREELVLAREDYARVAYKGKARKALKRLFSPPYVLFWIGYGHNDPNVLEQVIAENQLRLGLSGGYAVVFAADSAGVTPWLDEMKIVPSWLESYDQTYPFLKSLAARSGVSPGSHPPKIATSPPLAVHHIPAPVVQTIGRRREIDEVYQALVQQRSIVLTGLPGVGKSTVLVSAIRRFAEAGPGKYTDLCYHRLVEKGSAEERAGRLLIDLIGGLAPQAEVKSEDLEGRCAQARQLLSGRTVLFAIESADDQESPEIVEDIATRLGMLTIAVTSRQTTRWKSLSRIPLKGMSEADSVALFSRTYGPIGEETASVKELCQRVLGHPMMITRLALETRDHGLSPQGLLSGLTDFKLDRDLALRFDASLNGQSEGVKRALTVIGILDAPTLRVELFDQAADVRMSDLEAMADQQLVHLHLDGDRCTVHDLLRDWCRNRLQETGHEEALHQRDRIASFYLGFLQRRRDARPEELTEIDQEWASILRLIDTLAIPKAVLALVDESIGDHFDDPIGYVPRRWQTKSILALSSKILSCAAEVGGLAAARVEKNLGLFNYWRGDHDQAERLFHRARDRYRRENDKAGEASTTWLLGYLADDENRYQEALSSYEEGTRLAQQLHDLELEAVGHHLIGVTLYHQGHFEEAERKFNVARALISPQSAPDLDARVVRRLGYVSLELGRLDDAERILRRVAEQVERLERPRDAARIARKLALLHLRRGDLEAAETALAEARSGFEHQGGSRGLGSTLRCLATLRRQQGRVDEARSFCSESLDIARETGSIYGLAAGHEELAAILQSSGAEESAIRRELQSARNIYSVIGHRRSELLARSLDQEVSMKPPADLKAILFDLMDTLAFLEPNVYQNDKQRFADRFGVSVERFKSSWERSRPRASIGGFDTTEERIRWIAEDLGIEASDGQCHDMADQERAMWQDNVRFYDGATDLLRQLRDRGIRLAVLSNGPVAMRHLHKSLGLSRYMDVFLLSSQIGFSKPDRAIYQMALDKLELGPLASRCLYIGDGNDRELDGAREAGLFTIKINRPRPPYASLKNQSLDWDLAVDSIEELASLLLPETDSGST